MILLRIWSHVLMKSLMKHFLCNAIPYEVMRRGMRFNFEVFEI